MAALWAMQFSKEGVFEVIFEGDAAQVVSELHSDPPYLSEIGHFIESIIQELQGLRSARFVHVHRESNIIAAHVFANEAA